jgi:aryl-alcohol dehydrogenase-like predicted oxidoreductase
MYYPLDLTNASSTACTMYGYPGVAFVSSPGGSQVGAAARRRSSTAPALVTLEPGATADATLAVSDVLISNNCPQQQVQVNWVQVYPPDEYTALYAQSIYNLMTRAIELEVLPAAIDYGVGIIPWSPLEGGLLAGVLRREREGRRRLGGRAAVAVERNRQQIEEYEIFCEELGAEPATVALAWLLHQRGLTAPIIGPRTAGQLDDALHALDLSLDEDSLKRLDAIFPGYKTAPEHYAW